MTVDQSRYYLSQNLLLLAVVNRLQIIIICFYNSVLVVFHVEGVRLRFGTAASNGPIVHPPGDIETVNYFDRGKLKNSEKNLSQCRFVHHRSHMK
jgi:hypothetical protein